MAKQYVVEALRDAIREEMERDETVFCIGEDIGIEGGFGGAFTVTLGLSDIFGHDRILDTPISELGLVGIAVGAALNGMRPIADVQYADFLFCAMDQIVNQMAKLRYMSGGELRVPMVLRAPVGATSRAAQHGQSPESYFLHTPGLKIACPSTAYDAKGLLKTAVRDDNPVLFFEHKMLYGSKGARKEPGSLDVRSEVPEEEYLIPFGSADVKRPGDDITIIATLRMVYEAYDAANVLEKQGVSAEIIDPRTLIPLDEQAILTSVQKTGRVLVVHEDTLTGGWGAEVVARITEKAFDYLDAPPVRVCAPDTPVPFAPPMEKHYIPDADDIVRAAQSIL